MVLQTGHRRRTPRLDISWRENEVGHPRLAVVVPRYGRTGVRRNRLRRQLRELARRQVLPRIAALDLVIRSRAAAFDARSHDLAGDLEQWAHTLSA